MTSPDARTVGVVLIEPIGVVRASLRMLFDAEPDMEVLGEASDLEAAFELTAMLHGRSDAVVLVGLELNGQRDALWLIRAIREASPQLVVLATGTDLTGGAVSKALFVGADGFIHKNSEPERFIEATRRAAGGELVLEGLPRGALGEIVDGMEPKRKATSPLTEREQMVLTVAAEGVTAREIARRLGVRERTVTTHLNNIYRKLGANGRVGALVAATRLGVIPAAPAMPLAADAAIAG